MSSEKEKAQAAFSRLMQIMDDLREKCPWDKKQTIQSLRPLSIEELYELSDAILEEDWQGIEEELGDLMLHIVFYTKIANEKNHFSMKEMIDKICEKLIRRHPHVYGNTKVSGEEEVKQNWEKLKLQEGKKSVLSGVPLSLPNLLKAQRIQEKAAKVGFEWEKTNEVWEKVKEELSELESAVQENESSRRLEDEFGDVLFALVNYARYIGVDPENALAGTNRKFMRRFKYIEEKAGELDIDLKKMTLSEMDQLWNEAKKSKS